MENFGPYRIIRKMAVGGMAEIFLVRQAGIEGLERTIVLKRILPMYSRNQEFVTMFLDEARLMAALSHPNIAQVFDLGKLEDSYYLVMEHVRGPTLGGVLERAHADENNLPIHVSLGIALNVGQALEYLHSLKDEHGRPMQIVHRDLNPANVLISYDGAVKLIDFGIAKSATKVYETRTGVIKGTFGYIAPEQLTGQSQVDHRADVFALGVLLYEMTVGEHPFDASEALNRIEDVLNANYKRPSRVKPGFPAELDTLIAHCLAPTPEQRPDSVAVVIDRIVRFLGTMGKVPTMGELASVVKAHVPDEEGAAPLKALLVSDVRGSGQSGYPKDTASVNQPDLLAQALGPEDDDLRAQRPTDRPAKGRSAPEPTERTAIPRPAPAPAGLAEMLEGATEMGRPTDQIGMPVMAPQNAVAEEGGTLPTKHEGSGSSKNLATREAAIVTPRTRRKSKAPQGIFVAGGLALVVLVGGLAFVAARQIVDEDKDRFTDVNLPETAGEATAANEERSILVETDPTGAEVFINGKPVTGVSPLRVKVGNTKLPVRIRATKAGYKPQEQLVNPSLDVTYLVLQKEVKRKRKKRRRRR